MVMRDLCIKIVFSTYFLYIFQYFLVIGAFNVHNRTFLKSLPQSRLPFMGSFTPIMDHIHSILGQSMDMKLSSEYICLHQ